MRSRMMNAEAIAASKDDGAGGHVGRMLDHQTHAHQFTGQIGLHDPCEAIAHHPTRGLGDQGQERQFEQQDAQDFATPEAEHPQARQLARPLRERDPRVVVDNPERDDRRQAGVDACHGGDEQRDCLAKVCQRDALQRHSAHGRHGLDRRVELILAIVVQAEVDAVDDRPLAHQARQSLHVHHAPDAEIILHQRNDRQGYRSPRAFQQVDFDGISDAGRPGYSQACLRSRDRLREAPLAADRHQ